MKKTSLLILTFLFLQIQSVRSAWVEGQLDCGRFLTSCDKSLLHVNCQTQTSWVQGFISGTNWGSSAANQNVGKGVTYDTIQHAIIKYCRNNPLKDTADAAVDIYNQLY